MWPPDSGAELLNVSVDACGGLASDAVKLVRAIGDEGERWSAGTFRTAQIERHLLSAIAVTVQRGNALGLLSGYTQMTSMRARRLGWADIRSEEGCDDEQSESRPGSVQCGLGMVWELWTELETVQLAVFDLLALSGCLQPPRSVCIKKR